MAWRGSGVRIPLAPQIMNEGLLHCKGSYWYVVHWKFQVIAVFAYDCKTFPLCSISWRAEFYRWCKQVRRPVLDKPHDHEPEAIADSDAGDPRDMLIVSQALRIVQLEQRVRELEQCVCKLTKHEQVGDCDDSPQNATI